MVSEKKDEKVEENREGRWAAEEVPTQTAPMVVDVEKNKAYPLESALAIALNKLDKIEKALTN